MQEELDGLRSRIERQLASLSKSQQIIANYLLTSYDEAAFLSAADLAQQLQVSEATVVRFAKAIGYDGFPKMRRHLQELFRVKATPASRLQRKLADLSSSPGHVLAKVIDMEIQYLTEALHSISPADFDCAVEIILGAPRVFVRGGGPSAILADMLELRLRRQGVFAVSITDSGR